MAKLTDTLSGNDTRHIRPIASEVGTSSFAQLASVASQGLGLYKDIKDSRERQADKDAAAKEKADAKAEAAANNATLADAQIDLIDLEDERNDLALEEQKIATTMQRITEDGVTPEEQITLDALAKDRDRLADVRANGPMNPLQYQTRLNALKKSYLSDVNNGAIQGQINALFAQGRSNLTAPISSTQQAEENFMDNKFGVGNWSAAELGAQRGKSIYLNKLKEDAHNDFDTFVGQEAMGFMNLADDHVVAMRTALNNKGSISDRDVDIFRGGINSSTQIMLSNIDEAVAANRKNGIKIDPETVKASKQQVLDNQKFYLQFLADGQEFGNTVRIAQRLTNMNNIVAQVNKARDPNLAGASGAVMGSGTGGDLMSLAQLVSAPDSLLSSVVANLPESLRGSVTVSSLKAQAAQSVAMAIDGVDFKDLFKDGLVNRRLADIVAGVGIKTTDNARAVNSYLSVFEQVDYNDTDSVLELFNQAKTVNNLKNNTKGLQRLPSVAVYLLDNIKSEIRPTEAPYLKRREDGSLFIDVPKDPRERVKVGRMSLYTNKLLKKFDAFLNNYANELKINKEQLYADLLPKTANESTGE